MLLEGLILGKVKVLLCIELRTGFKILIIYYMMQEQNIKVFNQPLKQILKTSYLQQEQSLS